MDKHVTRGIPKHAPQFHVLITVCMCVSIYVSIHACVCV